LPAELVFGYDCQKTYLPPSRPELSDRTTMRSLLLIAGCLISLARAAAADPGTARVDFNRDVRPILAENCFACHGPDERARKGKLCLDNKEGAIAERKGRAAVVPGKPAESELVARITASDDDERMPPADSGKKLTAAQIEILRKWVGEGAEYQKHWSLISPVRPAAPEIRNPNFEIRNEIDRFVLARLEKEGLKPSVEADRVMLIRRVTLDLTGLPPTLEEVDNFLKDPSPNAYEKVVDRLLASPRYGERMALEWLDAARFADTHGYHIDSGRNMTRWREWVIDAFNSNMPFDRFTIEQLAGDLLPNATLAQKIASGFNRNHMINFEGGAIPEEYHTAYLVDRVNTTSTVWMGLTLACAQCHEHKFDPFTQKEYYQLFAFFNNVPENGLDGQKGNAVPFIKVPNSEQAKKEKESQAAVAALEAKLKGPMPAVDTAQLAWEQAPSTQKTEWRAAVPAKFFSKGRAEFTTLDDTSVFVDGPNTPQDVYTVTLKPELPRVTALRLEALPDERMKAKGPGRSENGNFVLTGVRVSLGDGRKGEPLKMRSASADFSQKDFPISSTIGKGSGWAILPEVGKPHAAVFELSEPLAAAGQELTVQLQFNSRFGQHQIGRFRISVTDSATPHQDDGLPANIEAILKLPPAKRSEQQATELRAYYRANVSKEARHIAEELSEGKKRLAELEKQIPDAMVMQETPKPRDTFMLVRGQYDKKGEKVTADTPASLPPLFNDTRPRGESPPTRLDLAKWLVRDDHPLTARVMVNRYWQMYFGTGIVKTAEDFGSQGEWPTHQELLDWLAVEFRESGWDVKHIQKLIVMSATYRQSSHVTPELLAKDPENRLLARQSRLRLPAEFIRDQALAVSGLLNGEIGGASVSPYQPPGIWEELMSRQDGANWTAQVYSQSHGKDLYRRTMYTFWKRTAPPPSLITFDAPDRETCTVRRSRTNTPLQALVLMNDPTYVEASRKLAERIMKEGGVGTAERIAFAFRLVMARQPLEKETTALERVFAQQLALCKKSPESATKLLNVGESPRDATLDVAELAAWAMTASVILNLDEAVTRN
jgi:cytochrome c553